MYEKVNPSHPDKIADRIAGAIVDLAYKQNLNPKIAVEVLIGHGKCHIIAETSEQFAIEDINDIVTRIAGNVNVEYDEVMQDSILSANQKEKFRCGDNGIFRGVPITKEQKRLSEIARHIYHEYRRDGKYIINEADSKIIVCQSYASCWEIELWLKDEFKNIIVNPLGYWTGGTNVDTGATNRKLGSDMGDAVTGGGLHGKDLSKADVSLNIYAHLKAQRENKPVELYCAIGDDMVDGKEYDEIVEIARKYIKKVGGFEKFAEWGLI